jgi:intermediate cleaving peptidase 55
MPPRWGQPTPLTHPHLLAPDEVRPGLSAADFEDRRRRLVAKLAPGGIVVLLGAKIQYSSQSA